MINLESFPDNIKKALAKHLEIFPEAKIIYSEVILNTPYKDKNIVKKIYKIYTLAGNYFTVLKCNDGIINEVCTNSMLVGEIIKIVENSPTWFRGLELKNN